MSGLLSDVELTRAAQSGDAGSLGLLLARHEAGMRAVSLSMLGYGPDAEDAVQDTVVVALGRIGDVRDPAATGSWLRMIVRNECRMRLRAARTRHLSDELILTLPSGDLTPDELLDRHVLRDWVWHAMLELSPPLRLVAMLRYFSDASSYEQIAGACELPIGTVRSRLSQVRTKLSEALLATADLAHDDAAANNATCRQDAVEMLATADRGAFGEVVAQCSPQLEVIGGQGDRGGVDLLLKTLEDNLNNDVRQRFINLVASGSLTIWETDLVSPPGKPHPVPPAVVWLMSLDGRNRVERLRLFHPQPFNPSEVPAR